MFAGWWRFFSGAATLFFVTRDYFAYPYILLFYRRIIIFVKKNDIMDSKRLENKKREFYASKASLWIRVVTSIVGLALLGISFYVPPQGVIDKTVLVAFAEIAIFVSALMWIDYHYLSKERRR
jgi:sterol desaturase/sphingolipid hydroxylase (fatty acid hydroxylase superfamily)